MKKVYLAAGSAIAAAGAMALPATAAHAAPSPGQHTKQVRPNSACQAVQDIVQYSTHGQFLGSITFYGGCVYQQLGQLMHQQTGLTERVQYYNNGKITRTVKLGGYVGSGVTTFESHPNYVASKVCQALVANHTSTVKYGPVCEYTSG